MRSSLRPASAGSTTMRPWRHAGGERPDRGTGVVWPPALADDRPKSRRASALGLLHPAWLWVSQVKWARAEASHVSSAEMLSGAGKPSFAIRAELDHDGCAVATRGSFRWWSWVGRWYRARTYALWRAAFITSSAPPVPRPTWISAWLAHWLTEPSHREIGLAHWLTTLGVSLLATLSRFVNRASCRAAVSHLTACD
jgi:hypothetical protein